MSNFRPKIRQALMALAVLGGMGCESVPVQPQGVLYEDVICEVSAGVSGHFEGPEGELPCSRTDPTACNGQPSKCYTMAFGMCGSSTSLDYTCVVDRANGQTCTGNLQCATRACNGGTCGQPVTPSPDLGTSPPTDMSTPPCDFKAQTGCPTNLRCLPKQGQGEDSVTECTSATYAARITGGGDQVAFECDDGQGDNKSILKAGNKWWYNVCRPSDVGVSGVPNGTTSVAHSATGLIQYGPGVTRLPIP